MDDNIARLREAVLPVPEGGDPAWLTDDCLDRFLRADGHDFDKAQQRLLKTLQWRASVQPEAVRCRHCNEQEPRSHYMHQVGWAKTGQPVIYSDIGLAKDRSVPGNLEHCVQTLECAIATMPEGVETYIWISDFHGFGFSDCDPRMAAGCLQLFAQNYPERMGKFIMVDAPYIFHKMYKLLAPYVDPVTAAKLSFVQGPLGKGGSAELRAALGELFDDELVEWMLVEMAENRNKSLRKTKSFYTACTRGNGVFADNSTHDCRGPSSLLASKHANLLCGVDRFKAPVVRKASVDALTTVVPVANGGPEMENYEQEEVRDPDDDD